MYVYRIEDPETNCGPYWMGDNELEEEIRYAHNGHLNDTHPGMFKDAGVPFSFQTRDMYAACASVEQLAEWFSGFMLRLHNAGYVLRIYDAQEVYTGTYQVCFNKLSAELVDEMSITDALATLKG